VEEYPLEPSARTPMRRPLLGHGSIPHQKRVELAAARETCRDHRQLASFRNSGWYAILLWGNERGMPSTEGIPMLTNELIASLLVGVMATFILALAWGHQISDLIVALD
jgi:hypothetical protein